MINLCSLVNDELRAIDGYHVPAFVVVLGLHLRVDDHATVIEPKHESYI